MEAKPKIETIPWPHCVMNTAQKRKLDADGYTLIGPDPARQGYMEMRQDYPTGLSTEPSEASKFWSRFC